MGWLVKSNNKYSRYFDYYLFYTREDYLNNLWCGFLRASVLWCWSLDKRAGRDFAAGPNSVEITTAIGRWTRVDFTKCTRRYLYNYHRHLWEKTDWGIAEGRTFRVWAVGCRTHRRAWARKSMPDRFIDIASDWLWEMDAKLRFSYLSNRNEEVEGLKLKA